MKILAIYDGSGPKYHRVLLPCYGLQQYEHEIKVVDSIDEKDLVDTDILFFNRMIAGITLPKLLDYREKYGFKMVCDLDDSWILDKSHLLYESYKQFQVTQRIHEFIVLSDIVTVTHDRLYDEVKRFNENCHILPNAIPRVGQFEVEKIPSDLVRLFWAGGITHKNDLALLKRPLQLIKRDKVKLVICGFVKGNPEWVEMAKIYTTDSAYNTVVFESLKVHEYYKFYAHCDISLIPLVDNEFNRHKSNLKILEAANIGSPVVVSKVHPYLDFPETIVNYVDAHSPWYSQINKLIKSEELRREQGAKLQEYCHRYFNFDKISLERNQIFYDSIEQSKTRILSSEVSRVGE